MPSPLARESDLSVAAHPFSPRPSVARALGLVPVLRFLPSLVTLLGLLLGLVGLLLGPSLAGLLALGAGLGCDVLDGQIARRLRLVTALGEHFDRTTDTLLAGATLGMLAARHHPVWLVGVVLCALVGAYTGARPFWLVRYWPTLARRRDVAKRHLSGRALATLAAMVVYAGAIDR